MEKNDILEMLGKKEISTEDLIEQVKNDIGLLPEIYDGISSKKANIRYPCAKVLQVLSEERPEVLYRKMSFFEELLEHDKRILKWNAIIIIANLAKVDAENRFDEFFDRYFSLLDDEYMVTVSNVAGSAGKIAAAKPHLAERITRELLKLENIPPRSHLTEECRNVILGGVISSFDMYFDQLEDRDEVVLLVKRQLNNTWKGTRVKAERFVRKHGL